MANPANVANLANAECCEFSQPYTTGSVLPNRHTPYIVRRLLRHLETNNCPMACVFNHKRESVI